MWSIVRSASPWVWPQLWQWYESRSKTYFRTAGGMGIRGVLLMDVPVVSGRKAYLLSSTHSGSPGNWFPGQEQRGCIIGRQGQDFCFRQVCLVFSLALRRDWVPPGRPDWAILALRGQASRLSYAKPAQHLNSKRHPPHRHRAFIGSPPLSSAGCHRGAIWERWVLEVRWVLERQCQPLE